MKKSKKLIFVLTLAIIFLFQFGFFVPKAEAVTYTATASWISGRGSVSPSAITVNSGQTATFTVTPFSGSTMINSINGCGNFRGSSTSASIFLCLTILQQYMFTI